MKISDKKGKVSTASSSVRRIGFNSAKIRSRSSYEVQVERDEEIGSGKYRAYDGPFDTLQEAEGALEGFELNHNDAGAGARIIDIATGKEVKVSPPAAQSSAIRRLGFNSSRLSGNFKNQTVCSGLSRKESIVAISSFLRKVNPKLFSVSGKTLAALSASLSMIAPHGTEFKSSDKGWGFFSVSSDITPPQPVDKNPPSQSPTGLPPQIGTQPIPPAGSGATEVHEKTEQKPGEAVDGRKEIQTSSATVVAPVAAESTTITSNAADADPTAPDIVEEQPIYAEASDGIFTLFSYEEDPMALYIRDEDSLEVRPYSRFELDHEPTEDELLELLGQIPEEEIRTLMENPPEMALVALNEAEASKLAAQSAAAIEAASADAPIESPLPSEQRIDIAASAPADTTDLDIFADDHLLDESDIATPVSGDFDEIDLQLMESINNETPESIPPTAQVLMEDRESLPAGVDASVMDVFDVEEETEPVQVIVHSSSAISRIQALPKSRPPVVAAVASAPKDDWLSEAFGVDELLD